MTLQSSIDQWSRDLPQGQRCKIRIRRRQCPGQRTWSARQILGQPAVIIANVELITHRIKLGDRVNINGDMYMTHAITMNQGGHFVSVLLNNGESVLYDGLKRKLHSAPRRCSRQKQTHLVLVKE